jgi:FMN hydrolase / 5-amino-6-(5-phospho-D-ribitylamino)uracil phosphatase
VTRDVIRTVAFDVMDTVLHDPFREALEAATGMEPRRFFQLRDPELYRSLERGEIDEQTYWRRLRERGIAIDPEVFHRVRRDRIRWIDGMAELLDALDGVVERATASNYPVWIEDLADRFLDGRFEHVVASCHLGVRKPDHAFYAALLERLGRCADEVLFVDDREANVEAARELGVRSHRFTDVATLRGWLVDEGVAIR